ncbi:MAG: PrgI family protein [Microgenomates group bacterium]
MEQHPVPQNVTTFQFRLIGDMTIKQFGYLAGGAILAYISYILPLPFFFTWPLTVIFAFMGVGFAFIPIEERPMDIWVLSFLKSVYAPTQFVWHRTQPVTPASSSNEAKANTILPTSASNPQMSVPTQTTQPSLPQGGTKPIAAALQGFYTQSTTPPKKSFFDSLFSWVDALFPAATPQPVAARVINTNIPSPQPKTTFPPAFTPPAPLPVAALEKNPELEKMQEQISKLQTDLTGKTNVEDRVLELQKEISEIKKQKQEMEERMLSMKNQTVPKEPVAPPKPAGVVSPPPTGPTVKIISPDAATRAGLPRLTTFSNVVTGIIKDNQGGLLPGVLVTVRDKEGVPLRALKTNKIGQFAASTQLPNGIFFIEVEDPRGRYLFDRAQITLNGSVMPAIEIIAKSKRDLDREVLVKQIFGQTTNT